MSRTARGRFARARLRYAAWLTASLCLLTCSSGGSSGSGGPGQPVAERFPIDGVVDLDAFETVHEATVSLQSDLGEGVVVRTSLLRWAFANDDRSLYVALEWFDETYDHAFDINDGPVDFDGVRISFDVNGNGLLDPNEDARTVIAADVGSQYVDQHVGAEETDPIGDGVARLRYDASRSVYQAELLITLGPDALGQDGPLGAATRYNLLLFDHVQLGPGTGNGGYAFPVDSPWPNLPLWPAGPHAHPTLPTDLEGLIVFISTHEEPNGEIYAFDPRTRSTTRITFRPGLKKENVSAHGALAHARSELQLEKLCALIFPEHVASRRILEKCGFSSRGKRSYGVHVLERLVIALS